MPDFEQAQRALAIQLRALCEHAAASNAFVFDAWGLIWCSASLTFGDDQERLYAQVAAILESLVLPLHGGGKLDRVFEDEHAATYCVSFGVTYVLGLWMTPETNELAMRRAVRDALPTIESLTLSLPPPDGPGSTSGAQHA
jgi:hypothetical protein